MATSPLFCATPKIWTGSVGSGWTAGNWQKLLDASNAGAGANGSKIVAVVVTSNDSSARVIQMAVVRAESCTVTSATPGVVTISGGHNLVAGDQVFFTAATIPTGVTAGLTYFVVAGGLTATQFEFATSAGGTAVNTSSTGTTVVANIVRIIGAASVAITAGTDGSTAAANLHSTTLLPGLPVDNDGESYTILESGDYLAISNTAGVTANKLITAVAYGGNF